MGEVAELYGPCRALGYCDCGGRFGCVDEVFQTISKAALEKGVKANGIMSKTVAVRDSLVTGLADGFDENGKFVQANASGYIGTVFARKKAKDSSRSR